MASDLVIRLLAIAITLAGFGVLLYAWQRATRSWPLLGLAWGLLVTALILWSATSASDKGVALGLVAGVLIALAVLTVRTLRETPRTLRRTREAQNTAQAAVEELQLIRRLWLFMLYGPLAGLASMALCSAAFVLFQEVGLEHTANVTIVFLLFPIAWSCIAVGVGYPIGLLRKTTSVFVTGLVSLACLWALA
ncbi:MAG: hypothetical protein AAF465_02060 [Pseudomonadota bacterium]